MNPRDSWVSVEDKVTGTNSPTASISTSHRSQATQWRALDANKTAKKYTCRSDWTVLHCVKNNNGEHHLPTPSSSEIATVKNFLAIFLLEEILPMLLQSLDEPPVFHHPQDSGDLSVGWRCFQKLLISSLGCVDRTHGEKGFPNLPQPCQQRSEPEIGFLAWQCGGIRTKLLQGRAL